MSQLTANEWLRVVERHAHDAGDGKWLEELVCDLGPHIPDWDLKQAYTWDEWPDRKTFFPDANKRDIGIDNVGIRLDDSLVAIQCKARSGDTALTKEELDTFASESADSKWSERWIVSNARFGANVEQFNLRHESNPLKLIDFVSPVRELALQDSLGIREDTHLTSMQDEAVREVLEKLPKHAEKGRSYWNTGESRGHIVLPCGTGKTRIAYRITKELVSGGGIVVVLVPSIALVSQIKKEFQKLARRDVIEMRTLAVCSDATAGGAKRRKAENEERIDLAKNPTLDTSSLPAYEVAGDTATNEAQVIEWLAKNHTEPNNAILALFSTYQSSHNTASGLRELGLKARLMICDEAHRTAGIKKIPKNGDRIRNFTLCHDKDLFPARYRLYQTATPRVYTNTIQKRALFDSDDTGWDVRSMNDENTFGPELFRLSYVEAVSRDLLSDYRIVAWGVGEREAEEAKKIADELNKAAVTDDQESDARWDQKMALRALTLAAFVAGCVPDANIRSCIAFCNRIKISKDLALAVASDPVQGWLKRYFKRLGIDKAPSPIGITHIDSSFPSNKREDALYRLGSGSNEQPFCISNVGVFGEGTDSPGLSAVAFLNPRKSPVDVIQSVGRAMRKSPNKEFGYILVPVIIPENHDPESFLRNSAPEHGWEELGQILQALRAHDGRIEDELHSLMEFYLPTPSNDPADHIVVSKEPYQDFGVFHLQTKTPTIEQVIAPTTETDRTGIEERLRRNKGQLTVISEPSTLDASKKPKSISAVVHDKNGDTFIQDLTYTALVPSGSSDDDREWDPMQAIETTKTFITQDRQRRKKQMRAVPPRKSRKLDKQRELGLRLLHLEKDALAETGIHLNLLERSGIQGGAQRDVNVLRSSVTVIARLLRDGELEDVLAMRLGMENVARSSPGTADACTVTAIIWLNAAIMHARLERAGLRQLRSVASLLKCISDVTPAIGLMDAWRKILIKDYVPIFEIAVELLQDVAFRDLDSVSEALRYLAKSADNVAEHYANLGMDHAGELFNSVMGNQRSDGAFFTRPVAASMLVELALHASGYTDWLNEDSWNQLRCFDPSCGSGTILVAMMTAIKRRIRNAGGDEETIKRFHRRAVEHLVVGADINHVALQLAACQLTLGEVDVAYEKMNLHLMEYGVVESHGYESDAKTGTIELILDERLFPNEDEIERLHHESASLRLAMDNDTESTNLADDLVESPVAFVLMNPPYTSWTSIGTKFDRNVQTSVRDRLAAIWNAKASTEPILTGKKSTIATLFEAIAMKLSSESNGVMGFVRPSTITTAEDARETRKLFASGAHIDYVLTCHDPANFNLSWDTAINECLILMSHHGANVGKPTRFINLHRFPESMSEACDLIDRAVSGRSFNGSTILWDYDRMKEGDWTPAAFADCEIATLAHQTLVNQPQLRYDIVNSSVGEWRPIRFDL